MLKLITAPTNPVLTTSEAKAHLRVSSSAEDTLIDSMVLAATKLVEYETGRRLITQTWEKIIDGIPLIYPKSSDWWEGTRDGALSDLRSEADFISLDLAPVASITTVTSYDTANSSAVWDSSNYFLDAYKEPARLVKNLGSSWPTSLRARAAIIVRFVAGYGSNGSDVPDDLRQAVRLILAHLYERRGDSEDSIKIPSTASFLMEPYRLVSL